MKITIDDDPNYTAEHFPICLVQRSGVRVHVIRSIPFLHPLFLLCLLFTSFIFDVFFYSFFLSHFTLYALSTSLKVINTMPLVYSIGMPQSHHIMKTSSIHSSFFQVSHHFLPPTSSSSLYLACSQLYLFL